MHRLALSALLASMLFAISAASAAPVTLTDNNSVVALDPSTQNGLYDWSVDGVNYLARQWFWFRIGQSAESALSTLPVTVTQAMPNMASLKFANSQVQITVVLTLMGGQNGSRTSDLAETIRINNLTRQAVDAHFFQYADLDLSAGFDQGMLADPGRVDQNSALHTLVAETVVTPLPSHYELNLLPITLNKLNDALPTTLADSAGPVSGDVTWAFEWDRSIPAMGSLIISEDNNLRPDAVPLPPSMWMGGLLLAANSVRAMRRMRARVVCPVAKGPTEN